MYLEKNVPPFRVGYYLMLISFFLICSCGQDPAFTKTTFKSGQSGPGGAFGDADANADGNGDGTGDGNEAGEGGNGNNPDGNGSEGEVNKNLPNNSTEVMELCARLTKQTLAKTLNYPERQDCSWNQNGNGERIDQFMQAREKQVRSFSLPDNAVLCSLDIQSQSNTIHYDDFLYFTMDKYLLVGSNGHFVNMLSENNGIHTWDWSKISGQAWGTEPTYCIEGSTSCVVPPHDVPGALSINLSETVTSELAIKVLQEDEIDFGLIATGDNDDGDCFHTEVNLTVDAEYVVVAPD